MKFNCVILLVFSFFCLKAQNEIWNKLIFIHEQNRFFANTHLEIDNFNNKYVLSFNSNISDSEGSKSLLRLIKYSERDKILWSKTIAETYDVTYNPSRTSLISDGKNNIYLSLNTKGSVTVVSEKYENASVVIKVNRDGEILNTIALHGVCENYINDMAIDEKGNLYIGGVFGYGPYSSVDCNFIVINDTLKPKDRWGDIFLAKLNNEFKLDWIKTGGTVHFDSIAKIEIFGNEVYFAGTTKGAEFIFDNLSFTIPYQIFNRAGFLAKTDTIGNVFWLRYFGLKNFDQVSSGVYDLKVLNSNNVSLAFGGFTNGSNINEFIIQNGPTLQGTSPSTQDYFLINYNEKGDVNWAKNSHNSGDIYVLSMLKYKNNSLLISGYFGNSLQFNENVKLSQGSNDIFVACYNANGEEQWIKTAGGKGNDTANSIALDQQGRIYVSGGTSSNPVTFGNITVEPPHPNNVFLARLSDDPILSIIPINTNPNQTTVYPNPTTKQLWLKQNANKQTIKNLLMYDVQGKLINQTFKTTNAAINVEHLATGIYFLNIVYVNGTQQTIKWCKQ